MALPKDHRLTKDKDFQSVFDSGKTVKNSFLFIKYLISKDQKKSRFGIVVSGKVSKKATVRNRIRRQISEIIRNNLDRIINNADAVIVTNSKIVDKEFTEIEKVVLNLLKKSKILK